MTTYYLNDSSLNWVITAGEVSSRTNTNLTLQTLGTTNSIRLLNTGTLYNNNIILDSSSISLNVDFLSSTAKMTIDIFNNEIAFRSTLSGITTNVLTLNGSTGVATFANLPTCTQVATSNSQLINKLYVDSPIQIATGVRGETNLICNIPKYLFIGATTHPSASIHNIGFLYPTKNVTITGLVTHTTNIGSSSSGSTVQRMVLVSFPSLTSNSATVVARTANDTSLWTATNATYARALEGGSQTLLKGLKYGIVIYSNSAANFNLRGQTFTSADAFNYDSTYDLQIGGTYASASDLSVGNTFTVSSTSASNVPYVSAY